MKVLILTADSNGAYPVPASKGGAVSTLIEYLVAGNNLSCICDMEILSFYEKRAEEISKTYQNVKFRWIKVPLFVKFLDWCSFTFIRLVKRNEKAISYKSPFSLLYYVLRARKMVKKEKFDKIILENNLMIFNAPYIKATGICVHEKTLDIKHNTFINTILRQTAMNNPLVNKDDIPGFGFKLFII